MKQLSGYADILSMAPFFFGCAWASGKFCQKFLKASKRNERLFVILSFGGFLILEMALGRFPVYHFLAVALYPLFIMLLVILLFRSETEKRILAACMLMMGAGLASNFIGSFLSCILLFFKHTINNIPEPVLNGWEIRLTGCAGYCSAILAVFWMTRHLEPVFCGKPRKWYAVLAIPILVIIMVLEAAEWGAGNGIMVRSDGSIGLYYDQILSHAGFMALTLIFLSAAGFYVFGMNRIYSEQQKSGRYHAQIAVYQMLARQRSQSERLRHDMKNHLIALSALCRNKEWEKLENYLKIMEDGCLESGGDMTGSKVVDALLYQKQKEARNGSIHWECDVRMPKGEYLDEFDLCVLFGNILDNAIEACQRMRRGERRFIKIQAGTVKKCFLMEAKNSMDSEEQYRKRSAYWEDSGEHGIGLQNVEDVAHRYNGTVHTKAERGVFVISVLIPLQDAVHDIKTTL